ncbi:MAG: DUF6538 domain-containing protein [Actinomycetota bacterium]
MSYLQKHPKTGMYWLRRPVPPELRPVVGKRELRRSLGTKDLREAKRVLSHAMGEVQALLDEAKARLQSRPPSTGLAVEEARRWAREWLERTLAEVKAKMAEPGVREPEQVLRDIHCCEATAAAYRDVLLLDRPERLPTPVEAVATAHGISVVHGTPDHRTLARVLAEATVDLMVEAGRLHRQELGRPDTVIAQLWPLVGLQPPPTVSVPASHLREAELRPQESNGMTISQAFERMKVENRLRPQTALEFGTAIRRFREATGGDIAVAAVTKAHVRRYKELLLEMPRALPAAERALGLPEIVARHRGKAEPRISLTTVNKTLVAIQSLLTWAQTNGYVEENVANGMRVKLGKRGPTVARLPFTSDDLQRILGAPRFSACAPAARGTDFWVPLIAMFSGARLEEIGQLEVADVHQEGGITYFSINDFGEGKSVKTRGSIRRVPAHKVLIDLGFLDYVDRIRGSEEILLFPDLIPDRFGKRTATFSKKWAKFLDTIGIREREKVFHSFRHAFKDAARDSGLREDIHDALMGHDSGGVGRSYGVGFSLEVLRDAIDSVVYRGVSLQGLN